MSLSSRFHLSPNLAAETGIHIGDGGLSIKRGGPHGHYQYEVTGHALEDQLYLIGIVMPTISAAYDLQRPGFYINPEQTWISLRYQSKAVALFKHETLGLPNGRKRNLSIPEALRSDPILMRHLGRELLATDGCLGFYIACRNGTHKYPRIQFRMSAGQVIEQFSNFLRNELGISFLRRTELVAHEGWGISHQHILQISRSEDVDTWRREIGFSNPSHMSPIMIFESLGECVPRTSIVDRLSFLSGRASTLGPSGPITPNDLLSVIDKMRKSFGFPHVRGEAILQKMGEINEHLLLTLGRGLPLLVES
jgi:hypothetical protein